MPSRIYNQLLRRPLTFANQFYSTATSENTIYVDRSDSKHHDLQSYLAYASRVGLDPRSSTFVGTHYEYTVQRSLSHLGFQLRQVGAKSDFGIDLLGTWTVPSAPMPLKVLLQCKALAKKVSPSVIRELEGAFVGAPAGWRSSDVLGVLVTQNPATKGIREALARSRWPMGFVTCTAEGKVLQMLWNKKAESNYLQGVGVGIKYSVEEPEDREVHLTWKGERVPDA